MTARVFSGEKNLPTVEQFNTGRNRGCIVRWDFKPIKAIIHETDKRATFGKCNALSLAAKEENPQPEEQPQGNEVDSGLVAYSEMRYIGKPDPDKVVADIEHDLALRYGDQPQPTIDLDHYRTAIAALPNE